MYFERGANNGLREAVQFFLLHRQGGVQETCQELCELCVDRRNQCWTMIRI
jgi:hypothetical protein